jgi:hypothetical protein
MKIELAQRVMKIAYFSRRLFLFAGSLVFGFIVFVSIFFLWNGYYAIHDTTFVHEHTPYPLLLDSFFAREQAKVVQEELFSAVFLGGNFNIPELTDREMLHMEDVVILMQHIVLFGIDCFLGGLFLFFIWMVFEKNQDVKKAQKDKTLFDKSLSNKTLLDKSQTSSTTQITQTSFFHKYLFKIWLAIIIGVIIFTIFISVFFSKLFIWFHQLFFLNDLWILPYNSYLIQTFPIGFFLYSFFIIVTLGCLFYFIFKQCLELIFSKSQF